MPVAHRLLRLDDSVASGDVTDMGEVDQNANAIHLGHDFVPIPGKTAITLIAPRSEQVLRVVSQLHDAHTHVEKSLDISKISFEGLCVLEPQNDARLAIAASLVDIGNSPDQTQQIGVLADFLLHFR